MSSSSSCTPGIIPQLLGCDCDSLGCALLSLGLGMLLACTIIAGCFFVAARNSGDKDPYKRM